MSRTRSVLFLIALLLFAFCTACRTETVTVTRLAPQGMTRAVVERNLEEGEAVQGTAMAEQEGETTVQNEAEAGGAENLVTLDLATTSDIPTLDPQVATDSVSISYIENLFVQLTNRTSETDEVVPEAATSWEISEDGLTYTFHLRDDIPWVYHNPVTAETLQVVDEEGRPRFVTADDFARGIRRACHPDLGSFYGEIVGRVIAGCAALLNGAGRGDLEALVDAVGVRAPDARTLVVALQFPASYFLSMTALWTLSAVPSWTIAAHGNAEWFEAGNIVTNGRYVLHEWTHGLRRTLLRNPFMPEALRGAGNVERVVTRVVPDPSTTYTLWLQNEVDTSTIPDGELSTHLDQHADETIEVSEDAVVYIGFVTTKPPFDDARVRRAFSAAIDRETLVRVVRQGQGRAMIHFAPPGIFGAPAIDEVGVGFDPTYAREQLASAGYRGCDGFPLVTLLSFVGQDAQNVIEYVQGQWEAHLGCPATTIQIEQLPFGTMLASTAAELPVEEVPHMYTLGWGTDYRDENNWVGDVLWCGLAGNRTRRACSAVDDLIREAGREQDPARRAAMYRQIEEAFFGPEGEMPIAPLSLTIYYEAVHTWLARTPALDTVRWYDWRIDWEAKQRAQE